MRRFPLGAAAGRALVLVLCAGAVLAPARAQAPDTLAQRELRAARDLERDGQAAAAREMFTRLTADGVPAEVAAEAHLGLARLAGAPEAPGATPAAAADLEQARTQLEQLLEKYPRTAVAPEALYRLAMVHLAPGGPVYDPERALGALTRVATVYSESPRAPDAIVLAAELHNAGQRPARARALAFRLLAEWPSHPAAARAFVALGEADAREGRPEDALVAFGRASALSRPDDPVGRKAIALATLVDRLAFANKRGARPFELDRAAGTTVEQRVGDIVVAGDGRLHAALSRDNLLLITPPAGPTERRTLAGVTAVAFDAWDRMWVTAGTAVQGPTGVGTLALGERTEPIAVAPAGAKAAFVIDARNDALVRVAAGERPRTITLPERSKPLALVADGVGGALVLETRGKQLFPIAADGSVRPPIPLATAAKEPVDVARDALGNIYVLDSEAPGIVVLSPKGEILVRQPLVQDGDQGLGRPEAIAVDRNGAVVLYDARKKRFVWMR